jgi:hypothetical protein
MSGALAQGVTQAFTYQGFLRQSGAPVNGNQQMRFRIYNAPTSGTLLWDSGTLPVNVNNGLFTVQLNTPASVWTGAERFLEIQVGATTLSPRVRLNPTPYANTAAQINMFQSGVSNPDRMVITHSPSYTDWGLQYQDVEDKFNFLSGGTPVMTVDLGMQRVGIGTSSPAHALHVETSAGGRAIYGLNKAASGGTYGVYGQSNSTDGTGVYGFAAASTGATYGVYGQSNSTDGSGVYGFAPASTGATYGVYGRSPSTDGRGVYGLVEATTGFTYGVYGRSHSTNGRGVYGVAIATSGVNVGVQGLSYSSEGIGVWGWAVAESGNSAWGVYGRSDSTAGRGVYGLADATTGVNYGVYGRSQSTDGTGVYGVANATTGAAWGVWGQSASNASFAYGVIGQERLGSPGHAVYADGTLAASGTKSFQIDHPLYPETHYLNHFCFEGPEPQNIYNGVVVLDARGEAWVQLPNYFEAINRDPRYTLTPIGAAMPNLHVAVEIRGNRFKIAGGVPGRKVSWEVKAIRNDLYVQRYGFQTEQEKEDEIKGKYLQPELYGQPKERGIHHRPEPESPTEVEKPRE